ncbi:MAG TPA: hypothetical protein VK454_02230 [Myxococcaceae bacterium]|nr:hypothetical protein [Myxococcaceae bacterium]
MPRQAAVLAAIVLACAGCSRRREPSPEFSRASEAFTKIYAQRLDDAYLDPKMREIEAQLQRVPADSLDAQAAADLLARIRDGRARMIKIQEETQAASAAARTPPTVSLAPRELPPSGPSPGASGPPDAGPVEPVQPTAGMPVAEFNRRFSDCFQIVGPVTVTGVGGGQRDSYELVDSSRCRSAHPTFVDAVVIADGQSLMGVVPKSALVQVAPPAGTPPAPVAGGADAG